MNTRAAIALLFTAGSISQAQNLFHVAYTWDEVIAGTALPVTSPNGILEPGEGALIRLQISATINGQDAIGQTLTYTGGPGTGVATGRGLGHMLYSLAGTGGDATGTWNCRAITPVFTVGRDIGHISAGGARVDSFGGAQWLPPGTTADGTNPIADAWRGAWTPASYTPRTVHFQAEASTAVPTGQQNPLYCEIYNNGNYNYWAIYFGSDFGSGIDITIGNGFLTGGPCYANCDQSTVSPVLSVNDFQCFINAFAAGQSYANCDGSSVAPVLNANDFQCYLSKYAAGCP